MDLTCTLVLLILSCTVFVNGCPDNCGCDSATFTVICSDFALSWKELVSNIPADTRQLELRKGTLLDASLGDESRLFSPHFQAESSLFLPDITKVAMSHVDIRVPLNEDAFQPITSTRELHLVFSSLKELNDATLFNDFTNLKLLNLSHNSLEELSDGMFDFLPKLTVLDLSFNKLRRLPHNVFDVVEKLESLHVNDNELKYIHPHSIGNLTSLHTLHIDSNSLETLHETALPRDKSFLTRLKLEVTILLSKKKKKRKKRGAGKKKNEASLLFRSAIVWLYRYTIFQPLSTAAPESDFVIVNGTSVTD